MGAHENHDPAFLEHCVRQCEAWQWGSLSCFWLKNSEIYLRSCDFPSRICVDRLENQRHGGGACEVPSGSAASPAGLGNVESTRKALPVTSSYRGTILPVRGA